MWQIKEMIALAMMAVCSYTDIKENNIYLFPLAVSDAGAVLISVISVICADKVEITGILKYDILLPLLAAVLIMLIAMMMRSYIGPGDGYLMAALVIAAGIRSGLYAIAAGFAAAAVYAAVILIAKKVCFSAKIAFAPFVLAGYMIVLINEKI